MERLYIRVKELRESHSLSAEELAEKIGVAKSTLSAYESGKKQVSIAHLVKLADYFEVTLDSLLDRSKETINLDLQNPSILNDHNFMLGDQPLTQDEIAEAATFIQVKRRMSNYGIPNS
ncbi:helix-turn-helix domain-containing protein [Planomicrobium sp. CPCC 101079]|uniref:helix-turn-helix domain-containing protein n=1 Tax=Planomicrobium sp. CPCC 101079 TaxID=2599618 RepID=UPI0011B555D4|nr:helix-turn-helix transcriptional regulator [Planomicrobium sp. CPCC 101079]TWT01815.1 helix-turn-helix transcriptional regulator [Planomicrobium sp. CPCC 101079]